MKGPRPAWWPAPKGFPRFAPWAWRVPGPEVWPLPEEWDVPTSQGWRDYCWQGRPMPPAATAAWVRWERGDDGEVVFMYFIWGGPLRGSPRVNTLVIVWGRIAGGGGEGGAGRGGDLFSLPRLPRRQVAYKRDRRLTNADEYEGGMWFVAVWTNKDERENESQDE